MKLTTLLALLTGQRCQTIHKLDINHMQQLPQKYIFTIEATLKQTKPGKHLEPIELVAFENKNLCIVEILNEYISRTQKLRQAEHSQLLISYMKPHKPVTKDTIARWVKSTLKLAGIDIKAFAPHSTRAASTSCNLNAGLCLTDILKAAGWSSARTFATFYKKPITKDNFGSYVLDSSLNY